MERVGGQPTVTVSVVTYNSSKYVLETLDSIKAQTWHNLILQVCDDCSTDNTVELCEKWIEANGGRFVKTKMVVSDHNTGTSGNANRSWDACETEYLKDIAGDDLLMPNCIEEFMKFVNDNPNAIITFSKVECFGVDKKCVDMFNNVFCQTSYPRLLLPVVEKMDLLLTQGNSVPASSAFYNMHKIRALGIRHDERIPLIEDAPKWVNYLKTGNDFCFLNKTLIKYRVGSGISTGTVNLNYSISLRAYEIFYKIPYNIENGNYKYLDGILKYEVQLLTENNNLQNTTAMKLQNAVLKFYQKLRNYVHKLH